MGDGDIGTRLMELLIREFELDEADVHPDATLREDLDLDSLDAMDLIAMVDKQLGLRVDEDRVLKMNTVGDLLTHLRELTVAS